MWIICAAPYKGTDFVLTLRGWQPLIYIFKYLCMYIFMNTHTHTHVNPYVCEISLGSFPGAIWIGFIHVMHTLPFKCRYTYIYVCVCVCVCMYVCVRHGMCTHTHIPTQPPTYVHTCCAYTNIHTHTQRHTHIHHSLRNSWAPTRFIREHCKTCKWSGITLVNRKNFVVHFDKSMRKEWGWREAKGERER